MEIAQTQQEKDIVTKEKEDEAPSWFSNSSPTKKPANTQNVITEEDNSHDEIVDVWEMITKEHVKNWRIRKVNFI